MDSSAESTKRTARTAHKKYVPSEKQRAEDERLKKNLDRITPSDVRKFDQALDLLFSLKVDPGEDRKR